MTFAQPALLWLLAPWAVWLVWEWRRSQRRAGLALKSVVFLLLVLALAQPVLRVEESRMSVVAAADVSASIPGRQLEREREFLQGLERERGRHDLRAMVFGEAAQSGWPPQRPADVSRRTDIESALRAALASLPPDRIPRVLLLSDGLANQGAVERAAYQAREQGVPVDTAAVEGRPVPPLRILSVNAPARAYSGERFPVEVELFSAEETSAAVRLEAEERVIGRTEAALEKGANRLLLNVRLSLQGATVIRGKILAEGLGEALFHHAVTLRSPHALLVSAGPLENEQHLRGVLDAAGFTLTAADSLPGEELRGFDLVIARNQNLENWPEEAKRRVERFINEGGGFLAIAGENSVYKERDGGEPDPLRQALPATVAPPRKPEGASVVLILDKSSSMEGKKMELARQSAIGVVENLRPIDEIGVLVFDNSYQWAWALQSNSHPEVTKRLISGVIADGGTQIPPALHEGFKHIQRSQALYKHILLLTDGISEEGDSYELAGRAAGLGITISTIGLGRDVNRAYLERIARLAEGKSYFVMDVTSLAQIVLRDVLEHTGTSLAEREMKPVVLRQADLFEGVDWEEVPPLLGWVRFEAKPQAETLLEIGEENDPLLARWQYGLGRAAVFASDAQARWAQNWLSWSGFDPFWTNLLRDLSPRTPRTEANARYEEASGEAAAVYRLGGRAGSPPEVLPEVYFLGPDGFRKAAPLERAGPDRFSARVHTDGRFGLFRIRPASSTDVFPELALFVENEEQKAFGADASLLRWIAEFTGGRFNPRPAEVFDAGGRTLEARMNLWPLLLGLAVLVNLLELAARKGWLPGF